MKAIRLDQVYNHFNTEPLKVEDLEEYYVSAIEGRGDNPMFYIQNILENAHDKPIHLLFAGYKGCGKSTELNLLQKRMQDKWLVVNFSVLKELDPVSLHYIELFIVTMEKLFEIAKEEELDISKEYLDSVSNWYQTKEIQEIKEQYVDGGTEFGAGAELNIPFFANFFSRLKASAKVSKSLKEALTQKVEPKLSQLIFHCNALIREVRSNIKKKGKTGLLVIIEDMDKLPLDRAENLFYNYSQQLVELNVDVIFTYPIPLLYHPRFVSINNIFDDTYELPMIKINERNGKPSQEGQAILRAIVARRMEMGLFKNPKVLEKMISYSGGCLRDLFRLIRQSALGAMALEKEQIGEKEFIKAYQKLKREYDNTIADKIVNGEVQVEVEEYFNALVELVKDPAKKPENTEAILDLRQNLTILGYNGEGWCDVHPIVIDILKERKKL